MGSETPKALASAVFPLGSARMARTWALVNFAVPRSPRADCLGVGTLASKWFQLRHFHYVANRPAE